MLWLWYFFAAQGLTLKSGQVLICDSYLIRENLVIIQQQGSIYSLQKALIDWEVPIKAIPKKAAVGAVIPKQVIASVPRGNLPNPNFVIEKLEVKAASLVDVLRLIADQVGFNLIIDQGVRDAQVTFSFKQIRWQEALAVLLRSQNLSFEYRNQLLQVGSFSRYDGTIE